MEKRKLIIINGKIETLSFFSEKIKEQFLLRGYDVYEHDIYGLKENLEKELNPNAFLITFNCIGLSGEKNFMSGNISIWNMNNIPIINILVDHPMYYHEQLTNYSKYASDRLSVVCIDRYHLQYIKSYYPDIANVNFMVLAGSGCEFNILPPSKRENDLIFTGNFTPCSHFLKYIDRLGNEYHNFYMGIIDDLLSDCSQPIELVCIKHIKDEIPDVKRQDIAEIMSKMIFIDLYVRFYLREKIITTIVDSGLPIKLIGKGFDMIKLKNNKQLSCTALLPTNICLKETAASKISLNVMPWFKDGSHDRILSSMLCGAISVTDTSIWISDNFRHMKDLVIYDIMNPSLLPDELNNLLKDKNLMDEISISAQKKALESHTWNSRVNELISFLL